MSFSLDVKDELCRVAPTCSHCDRAVLSALIRTKGVLTIGGIGKFSLAVDTDSLAIARLIIRLLHELYHLTTSYTIRQSVLHKTSNYLIEVPTQDGLVAALHDLGFLKESGGFIFGIAPHLTEKTCCASAYVRGLFLGSGFVSNPQGDFHFEVIVEREELAQDAVALLLEREIHAKVMQRRSSYMVYMKSGESICDFLAFVGAHQSALYMENQRVYKSIRNDVNRKTNAEIANQGKASVSAVDQIYAIKKIADTYGLANLPEALRQYIRLRVTYPDASLAELGQKAVPPLSKSAIYHRVRRIEQIARDIKD